MDESFIFHKLGELKTGLEIHCFEVPTRGTSDFMGLGSSMYTGLQLMTESCSLQFNESTEFTKSSI